MTHSTHFVYGYMVKDHSDSKRGHIFLIHHTTGKIAHTTAFATPVVEYWLEKEMA